MRLCARLRDSTKTLKLFRAKNRKAYQPGCRGRREHDKREVLRFTDRFVSRNFARPSTSISSVPCHAKSTLAGLNRATRIFQNDCRYSCATKRSHDGRHPFTRASIFDRELRENLNLWKFQQISLPCSTSQITYSFSVNRCTAWLRYQRLSIFSPDESKL